VEWEGREGLGLWYIEVRRTDHVVVSMGGLSTGKEVSDFNTQQLSNSVVINQPDIKFYPSIGFFVREIAEIKDLPLRREKAGRMISHASAGVFPIGLAGGPVGCPPSCGPSDFQCRRFIGRARARSHRPRMR
jgi:hypothetical protein